MNRQYAVLVGLSFVDAARYSGWDGRSGCVGCEVDVDFARELLTLEGFATADVHVLKSEEATAAAVLAALTAAVRRAQPGDLVVFYYSGHGGHVRDRDGDEQDRQDETLCLFDRQVIDDEIGRVWDLLHPNAYAVMISDSCHSASNARAQRQRPRPFILRQRSTRSTRGQPSGPLIQIGAARDDQEAEGWLDGGLFTLALAKVAAAGLPNGYAALRDQVQAQIDVLSGQRARQEVQYVPWGAVSEVFAGSRPLSLPSRSRRNDPGDAEVTALPDILEDDDTSPEDDRPDAATRAGAWVLQNRVAEGQVRLRQRELQLGKPLAKGVREAQKVTGVVLHQTGFARKGSLSVYDGITAHFVVAPDGQTSQLHPIERVLFAANEFNRHTVSIEFVGNFPSARDRWWSKFPANYLSRRQVESGRALLRHLKENYPQLLQVHGHIQSKGNARSNDPGPDVWRTVGMYAIESLGYREDLKIHEAYEGLPIPDSWRERDPRLID